MEFEFFYRIFDEGNAGWGRVKGLKRKWKDGTSHDKIKSTMHDIYSQP